MIRSDSLHRLTEQGRADLIASGASRIIDLRNDGERERYPNPFEVVTRPGDPEYVNIPILDEADDAGMHALREAREIHSAYRVILDHFASGFGQVARAIAVAAPGPVVVHCHAGKDRTGLVVALLLDLVGVPRDVIAQDYAESELNLSPLITAWLAEEGGDPSRFGSPAPAIDHALGHLDQRYGGAAAYLGRAGVADADLARLESRLVL